MSKLEELVFEEANSRDLKTTDIKEDVAVENTNGAKLVAPILKQAKRKEKRLVNYKLDPDVVDRLITLSMQTNLSLTQTVETILKSYLDAYDVKINRKLLEEFKEKNAIRGAKGKERKKQQQQEQE